MEDPDRARRPGQHDESADSGQRRRHAAAQRLFVQPSCDMTSIWLGAATMIVSETVTLLRVEPFWSWNTPIAWTGFILFADGVVYRARGDSWIRSAPREFAALALVSIPLWVVFEGFNRVIDNWNYTGLPENFLLRQFGYAWSFATIWPAIFEGAELIGLLRDPASLWDPAATKYPASAGLRGTGESQDIVSAESNPARAGSHNGPALSIAVGLVMLIVPFMASPEVA